MQGADFFRISDLYVVYGRKIVITKVLRGKIVIRKGLRMELVYLEAVFTSILSIAVGGKLTCHADIAGL